MSILFLRRKDTIKREQFKMQNAECRIITVFSLLSAQDEAEAGGAIKN